MPSPTPASKSAKMVRLSWRIVGVLLAIALLVFGVAGYLLSLSTTPTPINAQTVPAPTGISRPTASQLTLEIRLGSTSRIVTSSVHTVGELLAEQGIDLHWADSLTPGYQQALAPGMVIQIWQARPLQVQADGQTLSIWSSARTVGAALAQAGLPLQGADFSQPSAELPLPADGKIRLVRVTEQFQPDWQVQAYGRTSQPAPELPLDQTTLLQAGQAGVLARQSRLTLQDGQETARQFVAEWQLLAPQDELLGYGTKIVPYTLDTADGTIEYYRAVQFYATSYSPSRSGKLPTSKSFGITASGKYLTKGLVAIDRNLIPFGTRLYVPGYGFAEAADTGGGVKGRWIDLGYDDDNYVSWHGYVTVYFLMPAPANMFWVFP